MKRRLVLIGFSVFGWWMAYGACRRIGAAKTTVQRALAADNEGIAIDWRVLAYRIDQALYTGKCTAPEVKSAVAGQGRTTP